MSWAWCYEQTDGPATTRGFPSQAEAEAWVADSWEQLYAGGARSVVLFEDDRQVYAMSLEPA